MTKKLEQLFEIEDPEDKVAEDVLVPKDGTPEEIQKQITIANKIDAALPSVNDLEVSDREMDDIAAEAQKTFQDLMDLGMNVESRYSGRIFEVAASMMRNAVDAKAAKMEKKLKMVELQLKKRKLDQESGGEEPIEAEGSIIFDRNELLKRIANSDK